MSVDLYESFRQYDVRSPKGFLSMSQLVQVGNGGGGEGLSQTKAIQWVFPQSTFSDVELDLLFRKYLRKDLFDYVAFCKDFHSIPPGHSPCVNELVDGTAHWKRSLFAIN